MWCRKLNWACLNANSRHNLSVCMQLSTSSCPIHRSLSAYNFLLVSDQHGIINNEYITLISDWLCMGICSLQTTLSTLSITVPPSVNCYCHYVIEDHCCNVDRGRQLLSKTCGRTCSCIFLLPVLLKNYVLLMFLHLAHCHVMARTIDFDSLPPRTCCLIDRCLCVFAGS